MNQAVKEVANPTHKRGGYFTPHAILIAAIVAVVLVVAGVFATRYNATYFEKHDSSLGADVPHMKLQPTLSNFTAPATGSVLLGRFPATQYQDGIGACAAYTTDEIIDYQYRLTHPKFGGIRFSPRYTYDVYSNLYSGGQDRGSWPDSLVALMPQLGVPRWNQYPSPPYQVDNSIPQTVTADAMKHRLHVSATDLVLNGSEQATVDAIKQVIAAGRPVAIGIQVPTSFDNATVYGGLVYGPGGLPSRGNHLIVGLAYNDYKQFPDGSVGGVLVQNQWGKQWGVNGRAWLSYRWLGEYGVGVVDLKLAGSPMARPKVTVKPKFRYFPPSAPTIKAPPTSGAFSVGTGSQVGNVLTRDTHVNIGPVINAVSRYYGFSAPGYAALIGTESGFRQYAPHYPISGAGYCDYSAGLVQITSCTAGQLGIGNGSMSQANINYVFWYEQQDPVRELWLGGKLLSQFKSATCVDFPYLYVVWNMGPGYGCAGNYTYYHPGGMAYSNFQNYMGWWSYVWANDVYTPLPVKHVVIKKPFPTSLWNKYRRNHHKTLISPWLHHKLRWAATVWIHHLGCGGIKRHEQWFGQYTKTTFAHCRIFTWPRYHKAKVS